jgi:hypothetical protein
MPDRGKNAELRLSMLQCSHHGWTASLHAIGHVIGFYLRFQTLSVSDHCLDFDRYEFVGGGNNRINFLTIPIDQSIPRSCKAEIEIGRLKSILSFLSIKYISTCMAHPKSSF